MAIKQLLPTRIKKTIAVFFLATLSNQMLMPTVAWALTAGPTSPEATSFEPIDTTDMVSPLTGNLTYSLPLMEVPGPEGSYPLALAYHADVAPNEEASWVGLGWSLNPGAITRSVNGFADDFSDVQQLRRDYWAGGSRSTFGISVGLPCGVNFGLTFAQDTYQGFGVGASVGYGFQFSEGSKLGLGVELGVNPYGGNYAGADITVASGNLTGASGSYGLNLSSSIGVSTNFSSVDVNAGGSVSYSKDRHHASISLLGASISSGGSAHVSVASVGESSVYNVNANKIQTESSGFGFTIPLPYGFSIGINSSYTRYWSDETAAINTNGSLYCPQQLTDQSYFTSRTYDIYRLTDAMNYNIVDYNDPDKLQGGTFPDYDSYSVTAQGLSGNIRPYIFQSVLYSQNQSDIVQMSGATVNNMSFTNTAQFRFENDFSNSYTQAPLNLVSGFDFGTPAFGNNDGNYGYNAATNQLAGSKHVVWFTNADISYGTARAKGFIDTRSAGFIRLGMANALNSTKGQQQIGGFAITNASGVTYHYALPAYEYNEYTYTATTDDSKYTSETKSEPYAYTWYLTAITGPDYVDTNGNGLADDGDWGYWATFDYGKWADKYDWRNPAQGAHVEVDPKYKSYSQGTREVYYLDAIHTRTHTAIFEKEIRADGKSYIANGNGNNLFGLQQGAVCANGGVGCVPTFAYPVPSLRLKDILLLQNDQMSVPLNTLRNYSANYGGYTGHYGWSATLSNPDGSHNTAQATVFHPENVVDTYDVQYTNLAAKSLRRIAFNYDYSLCPGVPNSYDPYGTVYSYSPNTGAMPNLGKLTLLSVDFQGKGGSLVTPPIEFQYDLDPADPANQDVISITQNPSNQQGTIRTQSYNKFKTGDILSFVVNGSTYYCTLLSTTDDMNFNVLYLNQSPPGIASGIAAVHTKNPPYNKDAFDVWGNYKSDYLPVSGNENLSRLTTRVSNNTADAWCLHKVRTSLGAEFNINYEGDTYGRSVVNKNKSMIVSSASLNSSANTIDFLVYNPQGTDLSQLYQVGDKFNAVMLFSRMVKMNYGGTIYTVNDHLVVSLDDYPASHVASVSGNDVVVSIDAGVFSYLNTNNISTYLSQHPRYTSVTSVVPTFQTANIKCSGPTINYGGGVRVRDLIVDDLNGNVKKTSYNYNMLAMVGNPRESSGVTSYEPVGLDVDNLYNFLDSSSDPDQETIKSYRRSLYKDINFLLTISREVPAPGVMYEYVTVADSSILTNGSRIPIEGRASYQFRVFSNGMLGLHQYQYDQNPISHLKNVSLKNYTSQVGNLVRTIRYDVNGNKITESINHYLNDDIVDKSFESQIALYEPRLAAYNNQGVVQERFADGRSFNNGNGGWIYEMTMSGKDDFPVIQTGSTVIDYKNGTRVDNQNLAFDFYSGEITKTLTADSYGNRFINEVTPAYHQYPAMGVKVNDRFYGNTSISKNMLTQEGSNYTYKVDAVNQPLGVISASAQTWDNTVPVLDPDGNGTTNGQAGIWRMKSGYKWMPAGTAANNITPISSFNGYFNGGATDPSWKKANEVTLYNVYSSAIEATDINTNYAATRMGYQNSKVLITGAPARYNELAYTGAEDALLANGNFSSNISPGNGSINTDSVNAHTGTNSLKLQAGQQGFIYTEPLSQLAGLARDYSVAVWVKPAAGNVSQAALYYQFSGQGSVTPAQSYSKYAAGWYLLEMKIPASGVAAASGSLTVGCLNNGSSGDLYFDDFRFQPTNANTMAYVYDKKTGELTYMLGNNDLFTRYQYDAAGRLVRTYKEVLGKLTIPLVNGLAYNYALKKNKAISQAFTSSCGPNSTGTVVVYTVPLGRYTARTATDADALARADMQANGQNYANANGTCAQTIYARVEVENVYESDDTYSSETDGDVYVRFYTDPSCSPSSRFTLTADMDVTVDEWMTSYSSYSGSGNNHYPSVITASAGNSEVYFGNYDLLYIYNTGYYYYNQRVDFSVLTNPSSPYIPEQTFSPYY